MSKFQKNISTTYNNIQGGGNMDTIANITVDELHKYVTIMASKIAKMTVEENSIITGTIAAAAGSNYTVQLATSNSQVNAQPLTAGIVYNKDDYVYLIKGAASTEGGESPSYFIFGRVNDTKVALANASDLERFTAAGIVQENVVSGTVYDKDSGAFWDALKNYKALKIEGKFNTAPDVGVTVTYKDKDGEIKEEFKLDSAWMQGQPSNMQGLPQQRVIERTKDLADDDTVTITVIGGDEIKLTAGTLNKYLKDFSLEVKPTNKSYFLNELPAEEEKDTVRLEARLKYLDGAINSGIQYYWFVEMPEGVTAEVLADEDKAQANDLIGGDRWYCLNSYNDCNIVGQTQKIRIWNKSDNFIQLDKFKYLHTINEQNVFSFDSLNQIPFKFINKIKCVAVYEGFYINSEVFELVDYSKESLTIEISANQPDLSLITEDSEIILTCEVKQDNEMMKFTYSYLWLIGEEEESEFKVKKITTDSSPVEGITYYTYDSQLKQFNKAIDLTKFEEGVIYYIEKTVQYTQPTLKLKDTISNVYADNTYDLTKEQITVKCRVGIDGSDEGSQSDYYENSNELTVTSFVSSESTISEYIFYQYLISGVNETFTSSLDKDGYLTWSATDSSLLWETDNALANWTGNTSNWPLTGKTGAAARKYLNNNDDLPLSNDEYLYYTTKSVWIEEKLDSQLISAQRYIKIKEGDWSLPRLLRGKTENGNNLSEGAVNKINTFNDLTNGGKEQGFYLEDVYYPTKDEAPVSGKTYYLLSGDQYVKQESLGEEFEEGKTYYEYEPSRLFINAEFIQTGALKVADANGNSIFYADIDQKKVEIGGFTVDKDSISNNKKEEEADEQLYFGKKGLYLGNALRATVQEDSTVKVEIDGSVSISGSGNNTPLADVVNRQLYSVYSSETTKPSAPNWTVESSNTDSTGKWHKTYDTATDFWICQKYASSYVGSGWGQVTQLEEIIPYNLSIENDYMVVTTDSNGKVKGSSTVSLGTNGQTATVSCFKGIELVELTASNPVTISGPERSGAYELDYSDGKAMIKIINIQADQEVWTVSYKIGDVVFASSNIKVVKNKSGAQGEAGSTLQLKSSATTVKKIASEDEDGTTVYTYEPASVTFWLIREKEGEETKIINGYDFYINNSSEKATLTNGELSIELKGNVSSLWCSVKNSNNLLIDQETITFVSDGERGRNGLPGASVQETYYKYQISTDSASLLEEGWDEEKAIFEKWTGREENNPKGNKTYVWKKLFAKLNDASHTEVPGDAVLMPDMEAIELAAKWQIVEGRKISKNSTTNKWQFPQTDDNGVSILQSNLDDLTAKTPIIPEGDIGRWCYLYDRTVISGGAIVTGSITADKLKVNSLEAVSGEMGTLTAGEIRSKKILKEDKGKEYLIYDNNTQYIEYINLEGTDVNPNALYRTLSDDLYEFYWSTNDKVWVLMGSSSFIDLQGIRYLQLPTPPDESQFQSQKIAIDSNFWGRCTGTSALEGIIIPEGYTDIWGWGSVSFTNLKYLKLPQSLKSIGSSFLGPTSIQYLKIPAGIEKLGHQNFQGWSNLEVVEFELNSNTPLIVPSSTEHNNSLGFCGNSQKLKYILCNRFIQLNGSQNTFCKLTKLSQANFKGLFVLGETTDSKGTLMQGGDDLLCYTEEDWKISSCLPKSWVISTQGDNFIESDYFTVSHSGTVLATQGTFSGIMKADIGQFKAVTLSNDGYIQTSDGLMKLDSTGLSIEGGKLLKCGTVELKKNTSNTVELLTSDNKFQIGSLETYFIFNDVPQNVIQTVEGCTVSIEIAGDSLSGDDNPLLASTWYVSVVVTNPFEKMTPEEKTSFLALTNPSINIPIQVDLAPANIFNHSFDGISALHFSFNANFNNFNPESEGYKREIKLEKSLISADGYVLGVYMRYKINNAAQWTELDKNEKKVESATYNFDFKAPSNTIYYTGNLSGPTMETAQTYTLSGGGTRSDQNQKEQIALLSPIYTILFDLLQPVSYQYKDGTSGRTHTGFIAQDVLSAIEQSGLTTQDFAGYIEKVNDSTGEITRYLRYEEFITLCVDQIQKLKKRVGELETQLIEIKGE